MPSARFAARVVSFSPPNSSAAGAQLVDRSAPEDDEQVKAGIAVHPGEGQALERPREPALRRPERLAGERRRLRAGPRRPCPVGLDRRARHESALMGAARPRPHAVELGQLARRPGRPTASIAANGCVVLQRAEVGDQERQPGALLQVLAGEATSANRPGGSRRARSAERRQTRSPPPGARHPRST